MDKRAILKKFEDQIADSLSVLTQAAVAAHEAATHAEAKAEDQYDTRGLEASYLAGAQSRRAMELEELLALYRHVDLKDFDDTTPIASTAIVELESDGKKGWYFLMPKGGGLSITHDGKKILVVTPQSPLGEALLTRAVGDQVSVEINRVVHDYDILSVR
jgi:transcription elongation GreA/GreB family factor